VFATGAAEEKSGRSSDRPLRAIRAILPRL